MAARANNAPRISANKLGEYLVSRPRRQARIVYDQKYPPDYVVTYYRDAQEAISQYIASNLENIGILERRINTLNQAEAGNVYEIRRLAGNIEAIKSFMNLLDEIDLRGGSPRLGGNAPQRLTVRNVEVSVRPEIILTGRGTGNAQLVGGIKLHFPKANPLDEDAAGFVSALTQMYCEACLPMMERRMRRIAR